MENLNKVYENIISESWINQDSVDFFRVIYDELRDDESAAKALLKSEIYDIFVHSDSSVEFIQGLQRGGFLTNTDREIERQIHTNNG